MFIIYPFNFDMINLIWCEFQRKYAALLQFSVLNCRTLSNPNENVESCKWKSRYLIGKSKTETESEWIIHEFSTVVSVLCSKWKCEALYKTHNPQNGIKNLLHFNLTQLISIKLSHSIVEFLPHAFIISNCENQTIRKSPRDSQ